MLLPSRTIMTPSGWRTRPSEQPRFRTPAPDCVVLFDHFQGPDLSDTLTFSEGGDSSTADGQLISREGGWFRMTSGDADATVSDAGAMLNSSLIWRAAQGKLQIETRLSFPGTTGKSVFFGFTDTLSMEAPHQSASSGNTITSNATDACGFLYDTEMTAKKLWLTGVANDVDTTPQNTGVAPITNTPIVLRIEVATNGAATFFVGDLDHITKVGSTMPGAVTPDVLLTPNLLIWPRVVGTAKLVDSDYMYVSASLR